MNLLIVDGTNVVMRYAYAMLGAGQEAPDDLGIERVLGGAEWAIRQVATEAGATHAIICFDCAGETWRKELYLLYKATRPGSTTSWSERATEWMRAAGWMAQSVKGFEGDDVIATMAVRAEAFDHDVTVFSGDCDLLRLADIATVVQFGKPGEGKYVPRTPEWICQKYGIDRLDQMPMWKALVGDSSDEIPGIRGIGPVKASKMIRQHGDVESLLGAEIGISEAEMHLMLKLVTLRTDVPIEPIKPAECRIPMRRGGDATATGTTNTARG